MTAIGSVTAGGTLAKQGLLSQERRMILALALRPSLRKVTLRLVAPSSPELSKTLGALGLMGQHAKAAIHVPFAHPCGIACGVTRRVSGRVRCAQCELDL